MKEINKLIEETEKEIEELQEGALENHKQLCKDLRKEIPYTEDNYFDDSVSWCEEEAKLSTLKQCKEIMEKREEELKEKLKKKLKYEMVEKKHFISYSETAFDRDIIPLIDEIFGENNGRN